MEIEILTYKPELASVVRFGWSAKMGGKVVLAQSGFLSRAAAKQDARAFASKHRTCFSG